MLHVCWSDLLVGKRSPNQSKESSVLVRVSQLMTTSLLIAINLIACAPNNPRQQDLAALGLPDVPYIQPEFQNHLEIFKSEAAARGFNLDTSKLTIVLKNLPQSDDLVGECNPDFALVEIDEATWKASGLYAQEQILFHEFGHCLLNRSLHTSDSVNYQGKLIPVSLMASSGNKLYNENSRKYYLDELFDKSRAVDLTSDYIATHDFSIEKQSYMTNASTNSLNVPVLAFLNSDEKMEYIDPAQCSILDVTQLNHKSVKDLDEVVSISSSLSLQFKQAGSYIVNFDCFNDTYSEAFTIN
jgi:hypothetical protein